MVVQAQAAQMVYRFSEGDASMGDLLGGKGSNLCEMTRLGLPVPPGFVITTQVCPDYLAGDYTLPDGLAERTLLPLPQMDADPVRRALDDAVCAALGLDGERVASIRRNLAAEPSVTGRRYAGLRAA